MQEFLVSQFFFALEFNKKKVFSIYDLSYFLLSIWMTAMCTILSMQYIFDDHPIVEKPFDIENFDVPSHPL